MDTHYKVINKTLGEQEKQEFLKRLEHMPESGKKQFFEKLFSDYGVGHLHTMLHLDYVFQETGQSCQWDHKRIAVIAHVNYTDLIDYCFCFIEKIPNYIDIYITTKGDKNIAIIQQKIALLSEHHIKIVVPEDRGREISGLLVACKDILMQYEYICFVHDKKKNSGEPFQTVGQSFCDLLWENSIKNNIYIENVIEQFEKEPFLGLLAPPAPYMSVFFMVGFLGWTGCYEKTMQLAKRLHLNCGIDESQQPFVLGTTFWCRTKALQPLFEEDWTYDDFEPEPMPLDNTINHAIERILPYVAQSQGFYSGLMMTEEYASLYTCNYQYMLDAIVNKIIYNDIFHGELKSFGDVFSMDRKLLSFCRKYSCIYIYGAGAYGKKCFELLQECASIIVKGFIVSDGFKKERMILGLPVIELCDLMPREDEGIVIALNGNNLMEVLPQLHNKGFNNLERMQFGI